MQFGTPDRDLVLRTDWWLDIEGEQSRLTVYFKDGYASRVCLNGYKWLNEWNLYNRKQVIVKKSSFIVEKYIKVEEGKSWERKRDF